MRKNPYLKQEQEFRPLLMRGSLGNTFLNTDAQTRQALLDLTTETSKKTYDLNGVSFDMVLAPPLGIDGGLPIIKNVEMCTTECTQELFEGVMGFNYSRRKLKPDKAKRPVERVTWFDCISFCNKLSALFGYAPYYDVDILLLHSKDTPRSIEDAEVNIIGGNGFRLPTEEEWLAFEKAGTENEWSGTNVEEEVEDYAWYEENSNFETHPVATKKPNEWGMYDMSGNVWEWCWDKEDITDTHTSASRVNRGGSWNTPSWILCLADRHNNSPRHRSDDLGFRFARTIEQ